MSELQFPKNPVVGQEYDFPPYKYYWDGVKWKTKGIGYNPVNDLRDELEPRISDNESKVFEALRRSYADAGITVVSGSFEEGAVVTSANEGVCQESTGKVFSWGGTLPKTVAAGATPATSGGIGAGAWVNRTYVTLRSELAQDTGAGLVNGKALYVNAHTRSMADKTFERVSVLDFYDPTSDTDYGNAIRKAFAASPYVTFPAGVSYTFSGSPATPISTNLYVEGNGVTINIADGTYMFSSAIAPDNVHIKDLTTVGGKGAFQWTNTGINVTGIKFFTNCKFKSYTRCAVEQNHTDSPYWHFVSCSFDAANSISTIGAALGKNADLSCFDKCSFLRNRIHVKCQKAGATVKFYGCDFIQFDTGDGSTMRAFIWCVPTTGQVNSGEGLVVDNCKFGSENQLSTDTRVLYADELSGAYNADRMPNLDADSYGYISGHSFVNIKLGGANFGRLVYSTTTKINNISFDDITIQGTAPGLLIEVRTPRTTNDYSIGQVFIGNFYANDGFLTKGLAISNQILALVFSDRGGSFEGIGATPRVHGADSLARVAYYDLISTRIGSFLAAGGATKTTDIIDATGGTEAATFNFSGGSGLVYGYISNTTAGELCWLQFDARLPVTTPQMTILRVRVRKTNNGPILRQFIVSPGYEWQTYRFPIQFLDSASDSFLEFTSYTGDNINLSRVRLYQARMPLSVGVATVDKLKIAEAVTTTSAPSAGGAGALPATPAGYMTININGADRKVPYY